MFTSLLSLYLIKSCAQAHLSSIQSTRGNKPLLRPASSDGTNIRQWGEEQPSRKERQALHCQVTETGVGSTFHDISIISAPN